MIGIAAAFEKVKIPETGETFSTDWLPPLPDLRDYTEGTTEEDTKIPENCRKTRASVFQNEI